MGFHVGQKVVCVDDARWENRNEILPVKGCVYTVRSLGERTDGEIGIQLFEIVNAPSHYGFAFRECYFPRSRFRPVKETSIEIFTAMLVPSPKQKQRVGAER